MVRIAVVEDDPICARELTRCLDRFADETGRPVRYDVFDDGAKIAGDYQPVYDIILMDIEMPHMDGISAAQAIRTKDADVVIIFITNMAQYAIRGYTVRARAYVLKPVNYYGLAMELTSALEEIDRRGSRGKTLLIGSGTAGAGMVKIVTGDIRYIESRKHDLFIHAGANVIRVRDSMKNMESRIDDSSFARCGVSFLVNLAFVTGITDDKQAVVDGEPLPISRQKYKEFVAALTAYLGGVA